MSATAEASKTALEIYTPVIVGLGAVVLGLLANGILEWWKQRLTWRRDLLELRKALLFEVLNTLERTEQCRSVVRSHSEFEGEKQIIIYSSGFLIEIEPSQVGKLSTGEIERLSALQHSVSTIGSYVPVMGSKDMKGDLRLLDYVHTSRDVIDGMLTDVLDDANEAATALRKFVKK